MPSQWSNTQRPGWCTDRCCGSPYASIPLPVARKVNAPRRSFAVRIETVGGLFRCWSMWALERTVHFSDARLANSVLNPPPNRRPFFLSSFILQSCIKKQNAFFFDLFGMAKFVCGRMGYAVDTVGVNASELLFWQRVWFV